MKNPKNKLNLETSPYLLQHADNPVNWLAWNEESLEKAKRENKLLLISIGYSACHWCHVMAHESFEDESVAEVMNKGFVNIKVDREERPDLDQVYMDALQLMTGQGGWPLNMVALPDGRPVWGCTYLRKEEWKESLRQLAEFYKSSPEKMLDYAEKLNQGLQEMQVVPFSENAKVFPEGFFKKILVKWEKHFDWKMGGTGHAPKFPMPNNYHFLLRYVFQKKDKSLMDFIHLTLEKMAFGGIYDHVGGGFSRYSTDAKWHVPHFEKMLYDNAQLVSLYCDAYLISKKPLFEKTVKETLEFVKRELTNESGGFYSALDADSKNKEGISEEGAFYVWTKEELREILKEDFELFSGYFNINEHGHWEENRYVLIRNRPAENIAEKFSLTEKELEKTIEKCKRKLFETRSKRNRPGLDNKILTSWNAMMTKAFCDAYRFFGNEEYLETALKNAEFLLKNNFKKDAILLHAYKNSIPGFLEDYAFIIEAFLALYENTFQEKWLHRTNDLTQTTFEDFFDKDRNVFYFTSKHNAALVSRTIELQDNVVPASNSVMAKNLFKLSRYFGNSEHEEISKKMLMNMLSQIKKYPQAYSNWLDLALGFEMGFYEIAITGKDCFKKAKEINAHYIPNKILAGSRKKSRLPLLANRFEEGITLIYICKNNSCQGPVEGVDEALKSIV